MIEKHKPEEGQYEVFDVKKLPPSEEIADERPIVLFVGIESSFSSAAMRKGWEELGFRVEFIDWQLMKIQIGGFVPMWSRIIGKASMVNPQLIFLHIQNEDAINLESIIRLEAIAPVVNYNFDVRVYSKSLWMYDLAQNISLTAIANEDDVAQCLLRGANAIYLPASADYEFYQPRKVVQIAPKTNYPEIVMIAQNYANSNANFEKANERQEIVEFLYKEYPDKFQCYGMGQLNSRYVHPNEEIGLYHNAKIVIGQNNFYRTGYTSDRLFRVMGSGAMYITSYFPDMEDTFEDGVHLDSYKTKEELKEKIDLYLADDEKRKEVAANGATFVRSFCRWQDRFKVIVDNLKLKSHE